MKFSLSAVLFLQLSASCEQGLCSISAPQTQQTKRRASGLSTCSVWLSIEKASFKCMTKPFSHFTKQVRLFVDTFSLNELKW